jgi:ribosomal 50S subunit-recycling heat shock protein
MKVWVERREATTRMFEVSDETTIEEFRAQLSHRWASDPHDEQPRTRWVATEVYKEGSVVGANIDDSLTIAEADIREGEQLEIVWRRVEVNVEVEEGEEDEGRTKEGDARKRHWRLGSPRYSAAVWHEARQ